MKDISHDSVILSRNGVEEVQEWGIELAWGTEDSWYSGVENLKFLRNEKVGFLFAVANNRRVSLEKGQYA